MYVCGNVLKTPQSFGCGLVMRGKTFELLILHQNRGAKQSPCLWEGRPQPTTYRCVLL